MGRPSNKEVGTFLNNLQLMEGELYDIIFDVRKLILNTYQEAEEKIMYGGIVFFLDGEMFGGLFAYKSHVSLELSTGFQMDDPNHHLEGKGKYRRHLKLRAKEDVLSKEVAFYVRQAIHN